MTIRRFIQIGFLSLPILMICPGDSFAQRWYNQSTGPGGDSLRALAGDQEGTS
jgi:hypothetical protein